MKLQIQGCSDFSNDISTIRQNKESPAVLLAFCDLQSLTVTHVALRALGHSTRKEHGIFRK